MKPIIFIVVLFVLGTVKTESTRTVTETVKDVYNKPIVKDLQSAQKRYDGLRVKSSEIILHFVLCAIRLDTSCILNDAEELVNKANSRLLQQADAEARRMSTLTGKKVQETPSELISSIAKLLVKVPGLVKESIRSLMHGNNVEVRGIDIDDIDESEFDDDDDEEEEEEEEVNDTTEKQSETKDIQRLSKKHSEETDDKLSDELLNSYLKKKCKNNGKLCLLEYYAEEEATKTSDDIPSENRQIKKKKKKREAIMKLLLIGLLLKAKLALFLKILAAKLQVKFFLIALANLLINLARFWWEKKGHHKHQDVIYYENAHHQHHYDDHEGDFVSGPGDPGPYHARIYDTEADKNSGQELAYSKHIPMYNKVVEEKPTWWNPWG